MRYRLPLLIAIFGLLLSACNFTLAADITPPPDYVAPPPLPTLGPLHPAEAPDIQNGEAIYTVSCLPCHGAAGLGDGAQGKQLPVTVAALGLPEAARPASPARWFTVVSQGNIDRFMPPFTSLSEQERWDVVGYALSLHTAASLAEGKDLYEANCAGCSVEFFQDQEKMASLSEDDLAKMVREGDLGVNPFPATLSDDQVYAIAGYLRSLSFAAPAPLAAATSASTEATPASETGTPPAEGTPLAGAPAAEGTPAENAAAAPAEAPSGGSISGTVANKSGSPLPSGLTITLRGYDHAANSGGPTETLTREGALAADGSFQFEGVELLDGRLFLAELAYKGISYQTPFASITGGETQVMLEPITVYDTTQDYSALTVDQLHVAFDFGAGDSLQVFEIFSFTNASDKAILVKTDGTQFSFIQLPAGAQEVGFEAGQNSATFTSTADGLALLPSETPYSLIAFFSLRYDSKGTPLEQPILLKTDSVTVFAPEGIELKSADLSDQGLQNISGTNFHLYSAGGLAPNSSLSFSLSGKPDLTAGSAETPDNRQGLIYGAGALGLALIGLGAWMYLRDRNARPLPADAPEDEQDEFDDAASVMDAILALDDLHRAKKIPDAAYQQRRAELKEQLKRLESRG